VAEPAPGVFAVQKQGPRYRLTVTGSKFTSRQELENYLAYRAAELARTERAQWFLLAEGRAKGDPVPPPRPAAMGMRYSFRMENWRPVWRYKTGGAASWKDWRPFAGTAFLDGSDPATITGYQVSADIILHKGEMVEANPLAFEA